LFYRSKTHGSGGIKVLYYILSKLAWLLGGTPTIADIDIYGVIFHAAAGGFNLARFPKISAWKSRVETLPGYAIPEELCPIGPRAA
jgi:glutathione S-transferase